jgi:hypothetical protein
LIERAAIDLRVRSGLFWRGNEDARADSVYRFIGGQPMKQRFLPVLAMFALASSTAFADDEENSGETPEQKDARISAQAGHYAAGVRVMVGSGVDKSFNFIGLELGGHYNVTDSISAGARIPFAVKKPDGFAVFGGAFAHFELRLGASIGAMAEAGFAKYQAALLSSQDAPAYSDAADYEGAFSLGPFVRVKAGPAYLSFDPAFVYQMGDPEALTAIQFPVTAMFRASGGLKAGAKVGIYTGDDFKLGADKGGRLATGLVVDVAISSIFVRAEAGLSSLLTDDAALYTSVGKSVYVAFALMYRH